MRARQAASGAARTRETAQRPGPEAEPGPGTGTGPGPDAHPDRPGAAYEPDPRRWKVLGVSLVIGFMALLDVTIVNVALPSMRSGLGTTPGTVQWVVSGYALAFGLTLVTGGRLGDAYGRRRMMLIGLGGFIVASAAAGVAPTIGLGDRGAAGAGRRGRPADAAELRADPAALPRLGARQGVRLLRAHRLDLLGARARCWAA